MLRRSYDTPEQTAKSAELAKKVTSLVVSSDVTYKEAYNALELVMETLETKAKPVIVPDIPQDDSGPMS
ncbi:MAG: hypothetical protein NC489_39115 [Ruminococcus flavefaciens]|nr:hypothetical protein [Ruminococcus flavefaciens]